nr:MAG TPA: hypothetical protein [Caudoviricetes sp.]
MNNCLHFRRLRLTFVSKSSIFIYTNNFINSVIMSSFTSREIIYYFVCNSSLFVIEVSIYGSHNEF